MTKTKLLISALVLSAFTVTGFAADPKPPVKATEKPKVLKPCTDGQTTDCRVVKKVEKNQPAKKPVKKDEKKK